MAIDVGVWPSRRHPALDWLVNETVGQPYIDNLFAELCNRLLAAGLPLARATLHMRTLHPLFMGARMLWRPGLDEAEFLRLEFEAVNQKVFLNSPVRALYEGAEGFRQRLDLGSDAEDQFSIYTDLRAEGLTDYVAVPMQFTDGKRHVVTWATGRPGGFTTEELMCLAELLPVLAMACEIRLKNRMAKNLLNAYVGPQAAEQILNGAIRRGMGMTVRAVIWTCDLRGFTSLSERWPRDDVIELLNGYFETMAEPVERHGGEILKFIGDAMLAIFPLTDASACDSAIRAAVEARRGMREYNRRRVEQGMEALGFGLAIHAGDVMYGNIGSKERLDFTVIGPAVNTTARLESLTKELRRQVLISGAFVDMCPCGSLGLEPMGAFPLRGVGAPLEVWALPEVPD